MLESAQFKYIGTNYSSYVRIIDNKNNYISNTLKIARKLKEKNIVKEKGNPNQQTNITFLDYTNAVDFMCDEFYKNQNIFINKK